jgi:hypothetical protein
MFSNIILYLWLLFHVHHKKDCDVTHMKALCTNTTIEWNAFLISFVTSFSNLYRATNENYLRYYNLVCDGKEREREK